jgi:hypothetical protein
MKTEPFIAKTFFFENCAQWTVLTDVIESMRNFTTFCLGSSISNNLALLP